MQDRIIPWRESGCPHCGSHEIESVLSVKDVPTQDGVLWGSAEAALASPVGNIDLVMCSSCGLVGNQAYEPEKVKFEKYDVATDHSPAFQSFIQSLAHRLVSTYGLRKKRIMEVGCGRAYFLRAICDEGANQALGIDPSGTAVSRAEPCASVKLINDYFSEEYLDNSFDPFVCRQVFDILPDQISFLKLVHRALSNQENAIAYFEVPNAAYTFGKGVVWNLVYEHRIWYFAETLRALFQNQGFEVVGEGECWNGEYLGIEVRVAAEPFVPRSIRDFSSVTKCLQEFNTIYASTIEEWKARLSAFEKNYSRIALWGAGARAIALLTTIPDSVTLKAVVDINPSRHGLFLPLTSLQVSAPESLAELNPDLVLISNPTYAAEIEAQAGELGLRCDFVTL